MIKVCRIAISCVVCARTDILIRLPLPLIKAEHKKLLPRETGERSAPSPTKGSITGVPRFSGPSASYRPRRGDPVTRREKKKEEKLH